MRQHFVAALVIMAFAGSLVGRLWYLAALFKNGNAR
jgi:hypothetical protein